MNSTSKNSGLADSPFFNTSEQESDKKTLPHPTRPEPIKQETKAKKPESRSNELTESGSSEVPGLQSAEVRESQRLEGTGYQDPELRKLQTYRLQNYDQLRRIDLRLTGEQKRFLDDIEEDIRQTMPELERDNPEHRRITKNSVIRVLVEIVRQLDITIDARQFRNEGDLLLALFDALCNKATELQSPEVPEKPTSGLTEFQNLKSRN